MSTKKIYEQIITHKLAHLPVPDLKDAIWQRIEQQLDEDLPDDTDGGPAVPNTPVAPDWQNLLYKAGPFVFVIALITLLIINKNHAAHNRLPSERHEVPAMQKKRPGSDPQRRVDITNRPAAKPLQPATKNAAAPEVPGPEPLYPADLLQTTGATMPAVDSSQPLAAAPDLQTVPVVKDTLLPKKPRGITGVTDSDYRLVPKKDSSYRRN